MDFLSTPLPETKGTIENFKKIKPHPRMWMKGIKQSKESIALRSQQQTQYTFGGKHSGEWAKILNGDVNTIRDHIKNGTMNEYGTYREWKDGFRPKRNQNRIKQFMTPIGVMTYTQAREAFGFTQSETIRNRLRSNDPKWSDWYFL